MLTLFHLADKQVRKKLLDHVGRAKGPVLVTMAHHDNSMRPLEEREPFATLEAELGPQLDMAVVVDEGKPEGMWRDPVGDLAEALYPADRSKAGLAAHGYFLVQGGQPLAVLKKGAAAAQDARTILEALGRGAPAASRVPPPKPPPPAAAEPPPDDPYLLLGIPRGTSLGEARKAFRALIAQYHPDKVAHLAPEFRVLAEERTRQLNAAWARIQEEE